MLALFAGCSEMDYPSRAALLTRSRVAVWDVLRSAERPGSLDSSIVAASVVPNDIGGFLAAHPGISHLFFNGVRAQALFKRHIALPDSLRPTIEFHLLPSTSPANASKGFDAKLRSWSSVRDACKGR